MKRILALVATLALPAVAFAEGDAAAGEKSFKKCQACHIVMNEAGEVLAGKAGRTGPNLFGMIGRTAGAVEGFRYKASLVKAGEAGLVWTEEKVAEYLQDPTGFLKEELGDSSARSAMSFKVTKEQEAEDLAAYLATFSPDAPAGGN